MKTNLHNFGQTGAAAVEFAVVLPLLVLLLFGSIEFGLLLYNQEVIINASREGARSGIARYDSDQSGTFAYGSDIPFVVENYCTNRLMTWRDTPPNSLTITVSGGGAFQSDLTVRVEYMHDFLFFGILGLNQKLLVSQTIMKMEQEL